MGRPSTEKPLIDRQHPHDFFMQLAAVWRTPLTAKTGLTLAGGPVGEPALGPVAFMHRASAAEIPLAPLGHHTFDSTHIAFGVVTAAVDHGPFVLEGSVFNGREPDQDRWDIDFGKLDSVSARLWYKPSPAWELQVSTGHLTHPEELEPGNIERTTASASWMKQRGSNMTAVTIGYGVNDTDHGTRHAMFAEATRRGERSRPSDDSRCSSQRSISSCRALVPIETASAKRTRSRPSPVEAYATSSAGVDSKGCRSRSDCLCGA